MPTQHEATRTSAKSLQIKLNLILIQFGMYGSSFATTWFVFANQTQISISKSNTHVEAYRELAQKRLIKDFKNSPFFFIINTSPHKRPTFDKRDNTRVLTNQKLYSTIFKISSTIFKISQVVADPFITLAFIFSPFGIKHQNGINLGPLTPLPH